MFLTPLTLHIEIWSTIKNIDYGSFKFLNKREWDSKFVKKQGGFSHATVVLKKEVLWKSLHKQHWDDLNCTNLYLILEVMNINVYVYTRVFQRLQQCTVLEGLCQWPSPPRVHWPSLVLLSFITMGRVMASPRPPHSAWLRCQHQASHAIKQLAPFINLTFTLYGRGKWR